MEGEFGDPFSWSTERRRAFIVEQGIPDASTLSDDECLAIISSFMDTFAIPDQGARGADEDDEPSNDSVWRDVQARAAEPSAPPLLPAGPPATARGRTPSPAPPAVVAAGARGSRSPSPAAPAAAAAADDPDDPPPGLKEMLDQFCEVTGAERNTGKHLLDALGWDLDAAIATHLEISGDQTSRRPAAPALLPSATGLRGVGGFGIELPRPPGAPHPFGFDPGAAFPPFNGRGGRWRGGEDSDDSDDDGGNPRADEYDEFGVRRPDAVRTQRLMDTTPRELRRTDSQGAREPGEVDWMFPQPIHLTFPGRFKDARELAKEEKKWILVNIQNAKEFSSQMLNRDTWTHETVDSLLRESFVFWQRGCTSPDGQEYMRLHALKEEGDSLPHIAIVDARTGARVKTLVGFIGPTELCSVLMDFLQDNDLRSGAVKKVVVRGDRGFGPAAARGSGSASGSGSGAGSANDSLAGSYSAESSGAQLMAAGLGGARGSGVNMDDLESVLREIEAAEAAEAVKAVAALSSSSSSSGGSKGTPARSDNPNAVVSPAVSSPAAAVVSPAPPVSDNFGPVPEDEGTVRVSVKLPSGGKAVIRRFLATLPVRSLFAFAAKAMTDAAGATAGGEPAAVPQFDLLVAVPARSLREGGLDKSIGDCDLNGAQVRVHLLA